MLLLYAVKAAINDHGNFVGIALLWLVENSRCSFKLYVTYINDIQLARRTRRALGQIWSRSGNLRSTLMQTGHSLYALAWSPDSESVVVGAGRDLAIKGVQVRSYLVSINTLGSRFSDLK